MVNGVELGRSYYVIRLIFSRKSDAMKGFIEKYNLPELKASYYITAMNIYLNYFRSSNPKSEVRIYYMHKIQIVTNEILQ